MRGVEHRRIQDFVRGGKALLAPRGGARPSWGGGARPSWPPGGGGGGGGKALLARASLFGEQYFVGRGGGGKAPLAPPGSAHVESTPFCKEDTPPPPPKPTPLISRTKSMSRCG